MPVTCSSDAAWLSPSIWICEPVALSASEVKSVSAHLAHLRNFACSSSAVSFNFGAGFRYHSRTRTVLGKEVAAVLVWVCAPAVHKASSVPSTTEMCFTGPPLGLPHRQQRFPAPRWPHPSVHALSRGRPPARSPACRPEHTRRTTRVAMHLLPPGKCPSCPRLS